MTPKHNDKYFISEEHLSEMIGFQLFAKPELTRIIRSQELMEMMVE